MSSARLDVEDVEDESSMVMLWFALFAFLIVMNNGFVVVKSENFFVFAQR